MATTDDRRQERWPGPRGRELEQEVDEELAFHLDMRTRDYETVGLDARSAREQAQRRFGDLDRVRRETLRSRRAAVRQVRRTLLLDGVVQDLRLGVRQLRRRPGFTSVAAVVLALAIGANTAIFSVLYTVLLQPLPFPEPERLVQIWETRLQRGWQSVSFSEPNFHDFRERNRSFEDLGALRFGSVNLTGSGEPAHLDGGWISAGFFRLLGVRPVVGRTFLPGDAEPGNRVALLSNRLWRSRFGADPNVVGRTLRLEDEPFTVVGVLPAGEPWLNAADVFLPLVRDPEASRSNHILAVLGRLRPEVSMAAALADLKTVAEGLAGEYPDANEDLGVRFIPSGAWVAGDNLRRALWVLMGAVGVLLLIAGANLANLLAAHAVGRRREAAVCAALGAGRGRLAQRVLTESALLGLAGAGLGVPLAVGGVELLKRFEPGSIPRLAEVGIHPWVLGFTLLAALATGLASGLLPALQTPYANLSAALRAGDRGVAGDRKQNRIRGFLVAAEVALSLVLLVGAGLLIRSFLELQAVDPGFEVKNRLSFEVNLPAGYGEQQRWNDFLEQYVARIESLPQVVSAAAVSIRPVTGMSTNMGLVTADGPKDADAIRLADWRLVTADYFRTMGVPLLRGRTFGAEDGPDTPRTAIISLALADRLWPGEDPVGRQVWLWNDPEQIATVVGVVGNMRERGQALAPTLAVYLPYSRGRWFPVHFVVHTTRDPSAMVPTLKAILAELDPNLPLSNPRSLEEILTLSLAARRFNMLLLGAFAGVALVLALGGIYGVLACAVSQRVSEIGVRVALGAGPLRLLVQIVGQGMRPVAVGIGVGLVGALALSGLLRTLLFGITPADPVTYAGVALILAAAALGSCALPALSALRVDPVSALQKE